MRILYGTIKMLASVTVKIEHAFCESEVQINIH